MFKSLQTNVTEKTEYFKTSKGFYFLGHSRYFYTLTKQQTITERELRSLIFSTGRAKLIDRNWRRCSCTVSNRCSRKATDTKPSSKTSKLARSSPPSPAPLSAPTVRSSLIASSIHISLDLVRI